jgi:hypothetical protein
MILRQPIHQRRRQQERLTAITHHEVLAHTGIVLNGPDGTLNPTATVAKRCDSIGTLRSSFLSRETCSAGIKSISDVSPRFPHQALATEIRGTAITQPKEA